MKINCFSYFDRVLEWRLEPVEFEDLTLLIGASGVQDFWAVPFPVPC